MAGGIRNGKERESLTVITASTPIDVSVVARTKIYMKKQTIMRDVSKVFLVVSICDNQQKKKAP